MEVAGGGGLVPGFLKALWRRRRLLKLKTKQTEPQSSTYSCCYNKLVGYIPFFFSRVQQSLLLLLSKEPKTRDHPPVRRIIKVEECRERRSRPWLLQLLLCGSCCMRRREHLLLGPEIPPWRRRRRRSNTRNSSSRTTLCVLPGPRKDDCRQIPCVCHLQQLLQLSNSSILRQS